MIKIFQIAGVILAGITAYFLWVGNKDAVFVALALAACSLFMSLRFQAKARLDASEKRDDILRKDESDG